jgi:hypothetical protein
VNQVSAERKPGFARGAPRRTSSTEGEGSGREAVLLSIKQALVISRLTLADIDAGADPYDRRQGPNPGSVWARRNRG